MNNQTQPVFGPVINRISDVMAHTERYAFAGVTRLAKDARVSASSVSRVVNGKMNPSFSMVARLTKVLEAQFGFAIDPRNLVAERGEFPNRYVCAVVGCSGCLPDNAYDEFGSRKAIYVDVKPGMWVTSRYPKGYHQSKEVHER